MDYAQLCIRRVSGDELVTLHWLFYYTVVYVNFGNYYVYHVHTIVILGGLGVYCFLVPTYYIIRDVAALRDTAGW